MRPRWSRRTYRLSPLCGSISSRLEGMAVSFSGKNPGTVERWFPFRCNHLQSAVFPQSLKLLFTRPITGEDVDAYVFGPIEPLIGTTVTLTCKKSGVSIPGPPRMAASRWGRNLTKAMTVHGLGLTTRTNGGSHEHY